MDLAVLICRPIITPAKLTAGQKNSQTQLVPNERQDRVQFLVSRSPRNRILPPRIKGRNLLKFDEPVRHSDGFTSEKLTIKSKCKCNF